MVDKPTLTSSPPAPSRNQPGNDYADKADAYVEWLSDTHVPEAQLVVDFCQQEANTAEAARDAAQAAALSVGAGEWVSGNSYNEGDVVWSPLDGFTYRATTNTSGTTDPSNSADWINVSLGNVQTTNGDDTAGRLLVVGKAFGIGGDVPEISSADDFDTVTPGLIGNANAASVPANSPSVIGGEVWAGWLARLSVNRAAQFLAGVAQGAAGRLYWRAQDGGTWGSWDRIVTHDNLVGTISSTVSESAVISRGSNANGDWVRFVDGTQICTFLSDGDGGATTGPYTWTFPATFNTLDGVSGSVVVEGSPIPSPPNAYIAFASDGTPTTEIDFIAKGTNTLLGGILGAPGNILKAYLVATGRWQ